MFVVLILVVTSFQAVYAQPPTGASGLTAPMGARGLVFPVGEKVPYRKIENFRTFAYARGYEPRLTCKPVTLQELMGTYPHYVRTQNSINVVIKDHNNNVDKVIKVGAIKEQQRTNKAEPVKNIEPQTQGLSEAELGNQKPTIQETQILKETIKQQ